VKCVDLALDKTCEKVHISFGEIVRKYLIGSSKVKDCNLPHEEHSKASLTSQLSLATLLSFLLVAVVSMMP